ncbi:MAG: hypothetical protein ACFCU6_08495 [Balneolaceae bacterium]
MILKRVGLLPVFILLFSLQSHAQFQFERAETEAGILRLAISNIGTLGKPDVRNNPDAGASMRYPAATGTEHLFEAGIWIGAFRDGSQQLVSTAAITDPGGFASGKRGFEFTADSQIRFEGEGTGIGISQQDIIANFTDRNLIVPGTNTVIQGHTQPLFADVELRSLNWNFPFTENFTIIQYDITNNSQIHSGNPDGLVWDSVYVGMYADLVARNVFTATDQGSAFFNKNCIGFLDDLFTTYVFDAGSSDNPSLNTYGAVSLIGSEYRGEFFHPSNPQLEEFGFRPPRVDPSYWLFSAGTGVFRRPEDDIDRFNRMAEIFPIDDTRPGEDKTIREELRTDGQESNGNYISFISIGPYQEVLPGETITVWFAVSAALKPEEFQGLAGKATDTEESRVNLVSTINSLTRVFQGEDVNNNGRLDPGEDLNDNGVLDRFLFPTPPDDPKVRIELDAGKAIIFWDRMAEESIDPITGEKDFEGYRIYRSDLGDDVNPTPRLIREFDTPGNDVGFNTGFDEVRLEEPVMFPGDTVEYWHRFEVDGLLSGWQYQFSVTAFDFGSEQFEIGPLETSRSTNAVRVFPGTPVNENFASSAAENRVGVYPNPYRVNAAWDGPNEATRKLVFFNLPARAQIRVYTLSGDIVARMDHNGDNNRGDIQWFNQFSDEPRIIAGGEHAWDILSDANQILTTGLYLYSVKDLDSGKIQTGKLAIIK